MIRLYRAALLLLPPAFRRRYGPALLDEAEASLAGTRGRARVARVLRLWWDLAAAVLREWWDAVAHGAGGGLRAGAAADARWAIRSLRRSPGFAAAVVGMLGIGIGASTVALGLVDAFLIRSLPYPESDRLMALWSDQNWSRKMVETARESLPSMEGVAGVGGVMLVLQEGGEPVELFVSMVTTNAHSVLGVAPVLGRSFVLDDGVPGAAPVAVLSYGLWTERFGQDPGVLGRSIALGGDGQLRRTVVGVMPRDYVPFQGPGVAAWVPVIIDSAQDSYDSSYFMSGIGRLRPGATREQATAEIRAWGAHIREDNTGWFSEDDVRHAGAIPLARERTADRRTPLLAALGAALLVLLVACANVANLVVARTTGRDRELSVRAALGAGRAQTARVVLAEIVALAALGTGVGLAVAWILVQMLRARFPRALPATGLEVDWRWALAAVGFAGIAAMAAGLVPALQAARRDPATALAGGRGARSRRGVTRFQELLSAGQLALATAGIAAVGLLGRSLLELDRVDPGFDTAGAITFRVTAPPAEYPGDGDVTRFFREARAAMAQVPGVEAVGFGGRLPLASGESKISTLPEGWEKAEGVPLPEAWHRLITPGYLEALGVRVLEGRIPGVEDDRDDLPEQVVINRAAAELFWPGQSALGKTFLGSGDTVWVTVAAVVEDVRERGQAGGLIPALYIPHRDWPWRTMYAVARVRGEPMALMPALKEAVWSVSPGVPMSRVRTLEDILDDGLRPTRILALLAGVAGAVTLLLGTLGIYGVVSHTVASRVRELGVRAALGADRARLLRGELTRATRIVAAGLALGLFAAWAAGRGLAGVLFGVGVLDVPSFIGALVVLGGAAYLAALLPARRAAAVDPVRVMREE